MAVMERNPSASRTDAPAAQGPTRVRPAAVAVAPLKVPLPAEETSTPWAFGVARIALDFCASVMSSGDLKRQVGPGLPPEERYEFESPASRVWLLEQSKYR